jgi:Cdc6-like AAA superfamily ATPase
MDGVDYLYDTFIELLATSNTVVRTPNLLSAYAESSEKERRAIFDMNRYDEYNKKKLAATGEEVHKLYERLTQLVETQIGSEVSRAKRQQMVKEWVATLKLNVATLKDAERGLTATEAINRSETRSRSDPSASDNMNTKAKTGSYLPDHLTATTSMPASPDFKPNNPEIIPFNCSANLKSSLNPNGAWDPNFTLDSLYLDDDIKEALKKNLTYPFSFPNVFGSVKNSKGVLLYGAPGTGKTSIVRGSVNELHKFKRMRTEKDFLKLSEDPALLDTNGVSFLTRYFPGGDVPKMLLYVVETSSMMSTWKDEAERQLSRYFEMASATSPSILFFDEADTYFSSESQNNAKVALFKQLVGGLTNRTGQVFIIMATNYPSRIEGAIRSRFGTNVVEVPLPARDQRQQIAADGIAACYDENLLTKAGKLELKKNAFIISHMLAGATVPRLKNENTSLPPLFSGRDINNIITQLFGYAVSNLMANSIVGDKRAPSTDLGFFVPQECGSNSINISKGLWGSSTIECDYYDVNALRRKDIFTAPIVPKWTTDKLPPQSPNWTRLKVRGEALMPPMLNAETLISLYHSNGNRFSASTSIEALIDQMRFNEEIGKTNSDTAVMTNDYYKIINARTGGQTLYGVNGTVPFAIYDEKDPWKEHEKVQASPWIFTNKDHYNKVVMLNQLWNPEPNKEGTPNVSLYKSYLEMWTKEMESKAKKELQIE